MRRLLLFTAVLYVIWRILIVVGNRLRRRSPGAEAFSRFSARRRERRLGPEESLVGCDRCGVHVPASRAVRGRRGEYCSEACRREAESVETGVREP